MSRTLLLALTGLCHFGITEAVADPVPGRVLFEIKPPAPVTAVFSADGKWLAVAAGELDKSRTIRLWDVAAGKERVAFKGQSEIINIAIAPDGNTVASADWDESVKLWDVETGKERVNLGKHKKPVRSLAFAPDGKLLASGNAEETVKLWDLTTGKLRATLKGTGGGSVAFSPDGKTLATGDDDWKPTVKLWDVATLREKVALKAHTNRMATAIFSPTGETLATVSWDLTPCIWDVATGKLNASLEKHKGSVYCVAYSPDGRFLATACHWLQLFRDGPKGGISKVQRGSEVKVWDTATGKALITFEPDMVKGNGPRITALTFAAMGRSLLTVCRSGAVKEWNLARLYEKQKVD